MEGGYQAWHPHHQHINQCRVAKVTNILAMIAMAIANASKIIFLSNGLCHGGDGGTQAVNLKVTVPIGHTMY